MSQPRLASGPRHLEARELRFYRDRTWALLRRYHAVSMETGRLPSILGRECFRARVTSYRMTSFEDAVIFVHDIERCIERLDALSQQLIAKIVLQEYDFEETARWMGCPLRTIERRFPLALDSLTRVFLDLGILTE
jgi:hypothetical protein